MTFDEWFATIPLRPELTSEWRESVRALCWIAWKSGVCLTATKKTDDPNELDRLRAENERLTKLVKGWADGSAVEAFEADRARAEVDRLRAEAELYRRGYEAMGAADISSYLANCAGFPKLLEDIDDAERQVAIGCEREPELLAPMGELAAALRPFANGRLYVEGDCRRAAEALARYNAETKEQPK